MFEQANNANSFRLKWQGLHPYLKKGIIVVCILLVLSIITSIILIAVVVSWKPVCMLTSQSDFPVPGQHSVINVKTATVKEKKLLTNDTKIDVTVTTIKSSSRRLQEGYEAPSPSILSFDNGEGVVTQAFTPDDFTLFIDPDRVLAAYGQTRNLQVGSVAPENNMLAFDDQAAVLRAVEEGILKQAAKKLNASPDELTIEYQETVRIDLKSDGLYHFEQNDDMARSLRWKPRVQWQAQSSGSADLQSCIPEILKATDVEFAAESQIEVSVNTAIARLLQSNEPTHQQETNVACRSRPVSYKKTPSNRKVMIVDEKTFNCSYHCTGNATSRVCPVGLVKENKCGYKTANQTGKEKVRGRVIVTRRKQCAQMRKKCKEEKEEKEEKEKAAAAKSVSQPASPSAVASQSVPAITNNAAVPTPTPTPESPTPLP